MTAPSTRVVPVEATEEMIEASCREFVSQADSLFSTEIWPSIDGDDGYRGDGAWVRLLSDEAQHEIRHAMAQAYVEMLNAAPAAPVQGEGEAVAWRYPVLSARDEAIAAMARAMRNGQGWPAVFAPGAAEKLAEDALSALEADAILAKGEGHE